MIEELKSYIEELFASAPKTRASYELKEELMANSAERYFDLVEDKIPEKEALEIVINSIGDIEELFAGEKKKEALPSVDENLIKKTALYKAVAIGMYIMAFGIMVAIDEFTPLGDLGIVITLIIVALATCILVYVSAAYPKYHKANDTVVEEFKEWNSNQKKKKEIRNSANTIIWMIILIIYFLISFTTMAWHITWVMFLIGVCAQAILNLLFQLYDN